MLVLSCILAVFHDAFINRILYVFERNSDRKLKLPVVVTSAWSLRSFSYPNRFGWVDCLFCYHESENKCLCTSHYNL